MDDGLRHIEERFPDQRDMLPFYSEYMKLGLSSGRRGLTEIKRGDHYSIDVTIGYGTRLDPGTTVFEKLEIESKKTLERIVTQVRYQKMHLRRFGPLTVLDTKAHWKIIISICAYKILVERIGWRSYELHICTLCRAYGNSRMV